MNTLLKISLSALIATTFLSSCEKNDEDNSIITVYLNQTEIPYDENGVWSQAMTENARIISQGVAFSHQAIPEWNTWNGFIASRNNDTEDYSADFSWMDHQATAITGGGLSGEGTPYLIAYWNSSEGENVDHTTASCAVTYGNGTFIPQSIQITNTTYAYYTMTNGSSFSKQFKKGDYLHLLIYGVKPDGTKTGPVTFALADYSEDTSKPLSQWEYVNIEELGEVSGIYFQMDSSDKGIWGMNTPAYFAADRLTIKKP